MLLQVLPSYSKHTVHVYLLPKVKGRHNKCMIHVCIQQCLLSKHKHSKQNDDIYTVQYVLEYNIIYGVHCVVYTIYIYICRVQHDVLMNYSCPKNVLQTYSLHTVHVYSLSKLKGGWTS